MAYTHLDRQERYQIYRLRRAGFTLREIAQTMDRHASTIQRELHRNGFDDEGYDHKQGHRRSVARRHVASSRSRIDPAVWEWIESRLREEWSPEQIAGSYEVQVGKGAGDNIWRARTALRPCEPEDQIKASKRRAYTPCRRQRWLISMFNVYCDESRHTSDPTQPYLVIGAVQCPRERKREIVSRIHHLQARHATQGELGWKRVSPNRLAFYEALLDLFRDDPELRFRCLVADRRQLDHEVFNDGDSELGFYKLYYQMLVHWLQPGHRYHVYLDWQQNAVQSRFGDLSLILGRKLRGRASIACLEPVTSGNLPLIGLADILIGAVGYAWNGLAGSEAKLRICEKLQQAGGLQRLTVGTSLTADKVNIFPFHGQARG